MREPIYTENCCFNWMSSQCRGGECSCRCHVEVPVPMRPDCGHEAEIERYRQRSRDEDTARIRLNHERITLREALAQIVGAFTGGVYCTSCGDSVDDCECVVGAGRKALA